MCQRDIEDKDTNQISGGENYNGEMQVSPEGTDDKLGIAEGKISKFEDIAIETIQNEIKRKIAQKVNKL